MSRAGLLRKTLQGNLDALGLGFTSSLGRLADTPQKVITALGMINVLNAQINTLFHVTMPDALMDDDTDGMRGHVVDDTSASMVKLVWHTTMDSRVGLDVNNVANLVGLHVGGKFDGSMFTKISFEHVASASAITKR